MTFIDKIKVLYESEKKHIDTYDDLICDAMNVSNYELEKFFTERKMYHLGMAIAYQEVIHEYRVMFTEEGVCNGNSLERNDSRTAAD